MTADTIIRREELLLKYNMTPTAGREKPPPVPELVITSDPYFHPSAVPPNFSSGMSFTKCLSCTVVLVILFALTITGGLLVQSSLANYTGSTLCDMTVLVHEEKQQNFEVAVDYKGEKRIESVHIEDDGNIQIIHNTCENGREGGVAAYDLKKKLAVFKDANSTHCFFANTLSLPTIQVSALQLAAANKEVIMITREVRLYATGVIPPGFVQSIIGPVFAEMCSGLPSRWLEDDPINAHSHAAEAGPTGRRDRRGNVRVTIGGGGGVTVDVVGTGSSVVIIVITDDEKP